MLIYSVVLLFLWSNESPLNNGHVTLYHASNGIERTNVFDYATLCAKYVLPWGH